MILLSLEPTTTAAAAAAWLADWLLNQKFFSAINFRQGTKRTDHLTKRMFSPFFVWQVKTVPRLPACHLSNEVSLRFFVPESKCKFFGCRCRIRVTQSRWSVWPASFERLECLVHIHMKLQLIERNSRCIARLVFISSMVLLVSFLNLATIDQTWMVLSN